MNVILTPDFHLNLVADLVISNSSVNDYRQNVRGASTFLVTGQPIAHVKPRVPERLRLYDGEKLWIEKKHGIIDSLILDDEMAGLEQTPNSVQHERKEPSRNVMIRTNTNITTCKVVLANEAIDRFSSSQK